LLKLSKLIKLYLLKMLQWW